MQLKLRLKFEVTSLVVSCFKLRSIFENSSHQGKVILQGWEKSSEMMEPTFVFRATLNLLEEVLFLVKLHSSFCSGVHGCEKSVTDNGTEITAVVKMIVNPKK